MGLVGQQIPQVVVEVVDLVVGLVGQQIPLLVVMVVMVVMDGLQERSLERGHPRGPNPPTRSILMSRQRVRALGLTLGEKIQFANIKSEAKRGTLTAQRNLNGIDAGNITVHAKPHVRRMQMR